MKKVLIESLLTGKMGISIIPNKSVEKSDILDIIDVGRSIPDIFSKADYVKNKLVFLTEDAYRKLTVVNQTIPTVIIEELITDGSITEVVIEDLLDMLYQEESAIAIRIKPEERDSLQFVQLIGAISIELDECFKTPIECITEVVNEEIVYLISTVKDAELQARILQNKMSTGESISFEEAFNKYIISQQEIVNEEIEEDEDEDEVNSTIVPFALKTGGTEELDEEDEDEELEDEDEYDYDTEDEDDEEEEEEEEELEDEDDEEETPVAPVAMNNKKQHFDKRKKR